MVSYYGVKLRDCTLGYKLTKDNFITNSNKSGLNPGKTLSETECQNYIKRAEKNYDYNMQFFSRLDKEGFNKTVLQLCDQEGFESVLDLSSYNNKSGYYMMVMDEYCQLYIGCSINLKKRIMRHWSDIVPLDRVVFWSPKVSKMSIDSFRAFDTTRIYILLADKKDFENNEDRYIEKIPEEYLINRTKGGKLGASDAIKHIKTRNFNQK